MHAGNVEGDRYAIVPSALQRDLLHKTTLGGFLEHKLGDDSVNLPSILVLEEKDKASNVVSFACLLIMSQQ